MAIDTKQRVLEAAADLFQRQGYNATGLNQVLAQSDAPKGSLYFHFPGGKEQLAVEAVALAGNRLGEDLRLALADAPDARTGILRIFDLLARNLESSQFQEGCPVATVALESAAESQPIRTACDGVYTRWMDGLVGYLRSQAVSSPQSERLGALILSSLQGALLLARVKHDVTWVQTVGTEMADLVAKTIDESE
ncbi:TetR/AcrR family transcriptional regulator [Nocardia sp. NPDC051463]|uniref:TetR/AcrR family transcriptional regulator n=1 Tax=Nocardia sp. NPDC051463 TaxID=3154845 RepID=UPI0034393F86